MFLMTDFSSNEECLSPIALAQQAHDAYVAALDDLESWLQRDHNSEEALLLDVLDSAIRRREQGEWKDADSLPPADNLKEAIATDRARKVRKEVGIRREQVDIRALEFILILRSENFLLFLDRLSIEDQLQLMAELSDRLAASAAGLAYLTHTVVHPLDSTGDDGSSPGLVPAFHYFRLVSYPGNFLGDADAIQKATALAFARTAQNILPAVYAKSTQDNVSHLPPSLRTRDRQVLRHQPGHTLRDVAGPHRPPQPRLGQS